MLTAALGALLRHGRTYHNLSAFVTIVSRNSVSPPELSGNTPVTDVVGPVKVGLFHPLGNQLDITVLHCFHSRLDQFIHLHKPLLLDHRLNRCFAAVMGSHIMGIVLYFNEKPHLIQFLYDCFPCLVAIHTTELSTVFIDGRIIIQDIDLRQIMTLSDLKVVRVMGRRDLNHTGTEFHIYISVCHHRNFPVYNGKHQLLSDNILISVIIRIYRNSSITQHGFRSGRCKLYKSCGAYTAVILDHRILDMPEMSCLLCVFNFSVRNGGITYRAPVDNTASLVDPAFFVHFTEHFGYGFITALIHSKAFSVPVTGGTELFQLADDPSAILLLPLPGPLKKAFPPKIFLTDTFFLQLLYDLDLCRNAGMVCSGLPERIVALHPLKTDQNILHRIIKRMPHVKLSRNIWGRNHNGKGCLGMIYFCMKVFLVKPLLIKSVFNPFGIISFCKFFAHIVSPFP